MWIFVTAIAPRHLSPKAIGVVVARRRRAAHLGPLLTHDWRRTFVGDLLDSGARLSSAPLAGIRSSLKLAGHWVSSPAGK
jgi:hypothetical protein